MIFGGGRPNNTNDMSANAGSQCCVNRPVQYGQLIEHGDRSCRVNCRPQTTNVSSSIHPSLA